MIVCSIQTIWLQSLGSGGYSILFYFIFQDKGKQELNKLIARIGVPLDQAKQEYRYMHVSKISIRLRLE